MGSKGPRPFAGPGQRPGLALPVLLLLLLGAAGGLSYADRVAFSVAADAIGRSLDLSDAALGALGGLAFSVLYALAGLPLGRLGDRGLRPPVIAVSVLAWSVSTALSGRVHGFASLFAARVGVGLGEAGLTPNAMPLLAALFRPARHPVVFAVYWSLAYAGLVLGLWGGGVLVDRLGWRAMFLCLSLPGVPLAGAIWWLGRRVGPPVAAVAGAAGRVSADLLALWRAPGFGHVLAFGASSGIVAWAGLMWDTPFYMRRFGLDAGQAGFWFGTAFGGATALGTLAGGPAAQAIARRTGGAAGGPAALRLATLVYLAGQPFQVLAYLAPALWLSLASMAITTFTGAMLVGPLWSSMQACLPDRLRATGTVAYGFATSVVGGGLGPPLFGALSDALRPRLGEASLQASLVVAAVLGFWPALHLFGLARAGAVSRPRRCAPRTRPDGTSRSS